jgi:hypothetical protein
VILEFMTGSRMQFTRPAGRGLVAGAHVVSLSLRFCLHNPPKRALYGADGSSRRNRTLSVDFKTGRSTLGTRWHVAGWLLSHTRSLFSLCLCLHNAKARPPRLERLPSPLALPSRACRGAATEDRRKSELAALTSQAPEGPDGPGKPAQGPGSGGQPGRGEARSRSAKVVRVTMAFLSQQPVDAGVYP